MILGDAIERRREGLMEKKSEVDQLGSVRWGKKGLTDEQTSERLQGLSAEEKARVKIVYLFGNNLTVVPRALLELASLKWLDLSFNFISSLPSSFGQLTALEGLYLNNNQLATLPGSMTKLQQLRVYVNPRFSCFFSAHSLVLAGCISRTTTSCRDIFKSSLTTPNPLRLFSRTLPPSPSCATKRCGLRP